MRGAVHPDVIHADFFGGLEVIVNDHPLGADDGHLTHLPGFEPAALNGGELLGTEAERDIGHVFDARGDVGVALAVHRSGRFPEDVENDREIVRSQVPGNIDILLEETEVEALGVDVADFANVPGVDDLGNFQDRLRIDEGVSHHQGQAPLVGQFDQLLALSGRGCHGLFDQHVLAGEQSRFGERVMEADGSGHHDGVDLRILEQLVGIIHGFHARIEGQHVAAAGFFPVAHRLQPAVSEIVEIADQVGTPITAADHAHGQFF